MKCKKCGGEIKVVIGCRSVSLNCMDCGRMFPVKEYIDEMDEEMLERISLRPCDRV
jgi:uncharacterized Zn finger protein